MKIDVFPVRTPTIPPATHTNCYRVGDVVIDPASPWPDQQNYLWDALTESGWAQSTTPRIILTHHHNDHIGGVVDLARRSGALIYAHPDAELPFPVDGFLQEGDVLETSEGPLVCLFTPGHANGHLAFHHVATGAVIAGDLVAGLGTIVLTPPEGNLRVYLDSLARVQKIVSTIYPAHGPALSHGREWVQHYIDHRHKRTEQFLGVLKTHEACTPLQIAEIVYKDIPGVNFIFASLQVQTHLTWLVEQGEVKIENGRYWI